MARDFSELLTNFALFDDWQSRYGYLIDLGKSLAPLSDSERTDSNKVIGCVSQVWLVTGWIDGCLAIRGDSDAQIVRGLIFILCLLYGGCSADEVLSVDARFSFESLGFGSHLTPQRSNGFYSMVNRIRSDACAAFSDCSP